MLFLVLLFISVHTLNSPIGRFYHFFARFGSNLGADLGTNSLFEAYFRGFMRRFVVANHLFFLPLLGSKLGLNSLFFPKIPA